MGGVARRAIAARVTVERAFPLFSRAYPLLVKTDAKAAGLAVRARDTGRVLMLQRSIADAKDPARGKWEFPGGSLDDGESPLQGAVREWQEETGIPLPAGELAGAWTNPDGIYVGHVYVIPSEGDVALNVDADDRLVGNPDDPDGDDCETLAWWTPSEAAANPALRDEAKASTDWRLIDAAVPDAMFKSVRKAGYPVLVRSHVRHGALTPDVASELARYFSSRPGMRAQEAADHGFDPIGAPARYLACEKAEGYHDSLKGSGAPTLQDVLAWEQEEDKAYPEALAKEQPGAGDVHIDSASEGKRKRRRSDEPEEARELVDGDELEISIVKTDRAKQLLYGIVLEPHRVDSQGDWEDPDDIEKAAHRYLGQAFRDGVTDLVNLQHRWDAPGVFPVESYVAPSDFVLNGEQVRKGSWVLVMKVADPVTWQEVLAGRWGGFSVEGTGRRDYERPTPPRAAPLASS